MQFVVSYSERQTPVVHDDGDDEDDDDDDNDFNSDGQAYSPL